MADHALVYALVPYIPTVLTLIKRALGNIAHRFRFVALSDDDRIRFGLSFFVRKRQYAFAFVSQLTPER